MVEPKQRGFALLVVLWWVVLLAMLGTQLLAAGRLEAGRASNARAAAVASAAAEGALEQAVFHLLDTRAGWAPDGTRHTLQLGEATATVEIRSEAGKIGLNQASAGLLRALLLRLGSPPAEAAALADATLDWRTATAEPRPLGAKLPGYRVAGLPYAPPNADFETVGELAMVRGMTPTLLARLTPFISVFQSGDPDLALAVDIVRLACLDAGEVGADDVDRAEAAAPVATVAIEVKTSSGARVVRHAVVRLAADATGRPYQLLLLE